MLILWEENTNNIFITFLNQSEREYIWSEVQRSVFLFMQYDYWSRISRSMVLINDIWSGVFHSASDVCERADWLLDYLDAKFSTWKRKLCDSVGLLSVCLKKRRRLQLFLFTIMCKKHDTRVRDNIKHTLLTNLVFTYF